MSGEVYGFCDNKCKHEVIKKKDIAIITGSQTLTYEESTYKENSWQVSYPEGFNKANTIVLSFLAGVKNCFDTSKETTVGAYGEKEDITALMSGTMPKRIILTNSNIDVRCTNTLTSQEAPIEYKIVLMKI